MAQNKVLRVGLPKYNWGDIKKQLPNIKAMQRVLDKWGCDYSQFQKTRRYEFEKAIILHDKNVVSSDDDDNNDYDNNNAGVYRPRNSRRKTQRKGKNKTKRKGKTQSKTKRKGKRAVGRVQKVMQNPLLTTCINEQKDKNDNDDIHDNDDNDDDGESDSDNIDLELLTRAMLEMREFANEANESQCIGKNDIFPEHCLKLVWEEELGVDDFKEMVMKEDPMLYSNNLKFKIGQIKKIRRFIQKNDDNIQKNDDNNSHASGCSDLGVHYIQKCIQLARSGGKVDYTKLAKCIDQKPIAIKKRISFKCRYQLFVQVCYVIKKVEEKRNEAHEEAKQLGLKKPKAISFTFVWAELYGGQGGNTTKRRLLKYRNQPGHIK